MDHHDQAQDHYLSKVVQNKIEQSLQDDSMHATLCRSLTSRRWEITHTINEERLTSVAKKHELLAAHASSKRSEYMGARAHS